MNYEKIIDQLKEEIEKLDKRVKELERSQSSFIKKEDLRLELHKLDTSKRY